MKKLCKSSREHAKKIILTSSGWGRQSYPTRFSPVTSRNVRISRENFLTFIFNPHYHDDLNFIKI